MRTRKVCLINPPTSRARDDIFFPMGLLVLATILRAKEIPVEIVDFDLEFRKQPRFRDDFDAYAAFAVERLTATDANVFGIGSICSNFPNALSLAKKLRVALPESKIILGGPQPSSVAPKTLNTFPYIDAVVVGEGERTLTELVESDWSETSLKQIFGIGYRCGEKVTINPPRPLIENLDELPPPDFSLVNLREYLQLTPSLALIEAGRGCPFRCSFCSTAEMWSRKYRAKSPGRILEEMRVLHEGFGIQDFALTHDNFTTSPKYVRQFTSYFLEHNREDFTWTSSARTDTVTPDDLRVMRRSGCTGLFYGVDSGSDKIQKAIDKHLDLQEFRTILEASVQNGIRATTSFVTGFPQETPEDLDQTILLGQWAKIKGASEVQYHCLAPLAGTKLYHENRDQLYFKGPSSDISLPPTGDPEIVKLLQSDSELFSSFFTIPTPHLDPLDVFDFSQFYLTLINRVGPAIQWIFRKRQPSQLYQDWHDYIQMEYPTELHDPEFIMRSFTEFI